MNGMNEWCFRARRQPGSMIRNNLTEYVDSHSVDMHLPAQTFLDLIRIYQNILHDPALQIYQTAADADTDFQQVGCFVRENL